MRTPRRRSGARASHGLLLALLAATWACTSPDAREDATHLATPASSVTADVDDAPEHPGLAASPDVGETAPARPASARPPAPPLPRLAAGEMPAYPRMSRRLGEEGWVEVAIDLREDGEVVGLAIAASSGSPRLDEAVLTAARTWRFLPRTGARGVDRMVHRIVFQLTRK